MEQHDDQPAPWAEPAPEGVSALLRELLDAGTVARWQLLAGALELARRQGAAQALRDAANASDVPEDCGFCNTPEWLRERADLAEAGEL